MLKHIWVKAPVKRLNIGLHFQHLYHLLVSALMLSQLQNRQVSASVQQSLVNINIWQRVQVTDNFLLFFLYIFSYEDRGSTISTVYSPKGSMSNNIEIGQGNLKLLYSGGKVTHYVNNRNLVCYCLDASIFVIFC